MNKSDVWFATKFIAAVLALCSAVVVFAFLLIEGHERWGLVGSFGPVIGLVLGFLWIMAAIAHKDEREAKKRWSR